MNPHLHEPDYLQRIARLITDPDDIVGVEDTELVEPVKRRNRRPSLTTIIRQATKAGLAVVGIRPDGTLITGKPGEAEPIDASDVEMDEAIREARREWH